MAFLCMSLETETAAQFPLAGMPPSLLPSFALECECGPASVDCFLLFLSRLAPSLSFNEQVTLQKSVSRAGNSLLSTPLARAHTCSSKTEEEKEEVLYKLTQEEPSLGPYGPRTPWLPSPPASPEQADSGRRPPRTPCELPTARATSPSSPTSTCPTTY